MGTVLIVHLKINFYFFLILTTMTIFFQNDWIYWKRKIDKSVFGKFCLGLAEGFAWNLKFIYTMMENNWNYSWH